MALRRHLTCIEHELGEWRLQFARWQVDRGQLTDIPALTNADIPDSTLAARRIPANSSTVMIRKCG